MPRIRSKVPIAALCSILFGAGARAQDQERPLPQRVMEAQALEGVGRFADARDRFIAMLQETEKIAPNSPDVASLMNNLGTVEADLGNYLEAERLFHDSLALFKRTRGEHDPNTIGAMLSLGGIYIETQRPSLAKPLIERAHEISANEFGPDHPLAGEILEALGILAVTSRQYAEAETPLRQALAEYEKRFGRVSVNTAYVLNELARAEMGRGDDLEAVRNAEESLAVLRALPPPVPPPAQVKALNILAATYFRVDRMKDAELLFKQALETAEAVYGPDHPFVGYTLRNYAWFLERVNRTREAKKVGRRSALILAKSRAANRQAYTIDVSAFVAKD
jgi:tetratricopeptide (TPR) repeat protein